MREEIARQPVTTHRYNGKRYLTFDSADQILALVKARLQASLLADEEISFALSSYKSYLYDSQGRKYEGIFNLIRISNRSQLANSLGVLEEK